MSGEAALQEDRFCFVWLPGVGVAVGDVVCRFAGRVSDELAVRVHDSGLWFLFGVGVEIRKRAGWRVAGWVVLV